MVGRWGQDGASTLGRDMPKSGGQVEAYRGGCFQLVWGHRGHLTMGEVKSGN